MLKWIDSAGGPLIVTERRSLAHWNGSDNEDYASACSVDGYAGVIMKNQYPVLVLGDAPNSTAIFNLGDSTVVLVRWLYAETESDVMAHLAKIEEREFNNPNESVEIEWGNDELLLFDSALPGDEADNESLQFRLVPGRYKVDTIEFKPDKNTFLILHRFTKAL